MTGLSASGLPHSGDAQIAFDFSPIRTNRRGGYYVTTPLRADQFAAALRAAANQEEAILAIFRRYPDSALTPSRVRAFTLAAGKRWPITSIRARITTLTKEHGLLEQTDRTVIGPEGKPEHLWRLASQQQQVAA